MHTNQPPLNNVRLTKVKRKYIKFIWFCCHEIGCFVEHALMVSFQILANLIWKKNEKNAQEIRKQKSLQSNCLLKLISILQFLSFDWNFMSLTMQNYLKFDWNPFNLVGPHFGIGVLINMLNQSLVKIVHNRMALGKFTTWFDCNPRCPYYMFFQEFFFLSKYFFFFPQCFFFVSKWVQ